MKTNIKLTGTIFGILALAFYALHSFVIIPHWEYNISHWWLIAAYGGYGILMALCTYYTEYLTSSTLFVYNFVNNISEGELGPKSKPALFLGLQEGFGTGLFLGVITGLAIGLNFSFIYGLLIVFGIGLIFTLLFLFLSKTGLLEGLGMGLVFALLIGLPIVLDVKLSTGAAFILILGLLAILSTGLINGLVAILISGLFMGLISGLFTGFYIESLILLGVLVFLILSFFCIFLTQKGKKAFGLE